MTVTCCAGVAWVLVGWIVFVGAGGMGSIEIAGEAAGFTGVEGMRIERGRGSIVYRIWVESNEDSSSLSADTAVYHRVSPQKMLFWEGPRSART